MLVTSKSGRRGMRGAQGVLRREESKRVSFGPRQHFFTVPSNLSTPDIRYLMKAGADGGIRCRAGLMRKRLCSDILAIPVCDAQRTQHAQPSNVGGDIVEFWTEILKFLFLGLLQGFTEPIPVSSSGHLMLAQHFLGVAVEGHKQLAFAVLVNFASLLAVLLIYRQDLHRLATRTLRYLKERNPGDEGEARFVLYIVVGTIPAAVLGLLFNDLIESWLTGVTVVGITLIITGCALWVIRNLKGKKMDGDLRLGDALIVGFAQALALIPGISRSGATIVAGMLRGMNQETALRYSFMLYIPVSLGGIVLEGDDILHAVTDGKTLLLYTVAFIATFAASYFALKWCMNVMRHGNLKVFYIYCFIVGSLVVLFG
jgi:undecaprenyl-diphosphatase